VKRILRLLLAIVCFAPSQSLAVVALLNNQGGAGTCLHGTASPLTGSLSVTASGSNRCAIASIAFNSAAGMSIGAVTYGGQTMTSAGSAAFNSTNNIYVVLEYLYNPPTGGNTLSVTVNGTVTDIYACLTAFTGCNSSTPVRAGSYTTNSCNSATSCSVTVTSNVNDLTLSAFSAPQNPTTNQTADDNNTAGTNNLFDDHATTAASSVTHTWTYASDQSAVAGLSVDGDSGAAAILGTPKLPRLQRMEE
jgi:hypothetical protein